MAGKVESCSVWNTFPVPFIQARGAATYNLQRLMMFRFEAYFGSIPCGRQLAGVLGAFK